MRNSNPLRQRGCLQIQAPIDHDSERVPGMSIDCNKLGLDLAEHQN